MRRQEEISTRGRETTEETLGHGWAATTRVDRSMYLNGNLLSIDDEEEEDGSAGLVSLCLQL